MKIAVILRNVPDLVEDLVMAGDDLDWDEISLRLNDFDDHALEEAVLIKEESGAEIVAIALANAGDKVLQTAIARGADRAVKIVVDVADGASSRALAPVYAKALKTLGVDLVVTGMQTPSDVFGQLVPYLGFRLGWPQINGVTAVRAAGAGLEVTQEYGGGRGASLAVTLPAALAIQSARQAPRYVSGAKLRQAVQSTTIEKLEIDAPAEEHSARVVALRPPVKSSAAEMFAADADEAAEQIFEFLKQNGVSGASHA